MNNGDKLKDDVFSDFIQELRKMDQRTILGQDLKQPIAENFQLYDPEQLKMAQIAYEKNQKTAVLNEQLENRRKRLDLNLPIIGLLVGSLVFPNKKMDPLGMRYSKYLKALNTYEEVLEDAKKEKLLEAKKAEAGYWFSLGGFEFEEAVSKLFQKSGHFSSVIKTKSTGDGGIDLILTADNDFKIFVQCKAHKKQVGPHVARDLYGAMQSAGVTQGIIISLGGVSQGVRDFIKDKNIQIIDVNGVLKMQKLVS